VDARIIANAIVRAAGFAGPTGIGGRLRWMRVARIVGRLGANCVRLGWRRVVDRRRSRK
jgi:hypothetical protein